MTSVKRPPLVVPGDAPAQLRTYLTGLTQTVLDILDRTGGSVDKLGFITITQAVDLDTVESDLLGAKTKTDYITITQAVDLDTVESSLTTVIADLTTLEAVLLTAGNGLTGTASLSSAPTLAVGAGTGITVTADAISTDDSAIVHDNLSGFVADEHVAHSGVSITAGSGLTGGGAIDATRTLNIGAGNGITVNANDVEIDTSVVIDKSGISTYTPSNEAIDRAWDANSAAGSISSTPTQAEVENIRDAVLELSDVVATLVNDLGLS